MKRAL